MVSQSAEREPQLARGDLYRMTRCQVGDPLPLLAHLCSPFVALGGTDRGGPVLCGPALAASGALSEPSPPAPGAGSPCCR